MLNLRPDWHRYPVGTNAVDLAEQVEAGPLRVEFWRHILRAAIDRMLAGCAKRGGKVTVVREQPRLTWQINDFKFVFLFELSYERLQEISDLIEPASTVTILTPPRRDFLAHKVLSALSGKRVPSVWAVDTYLSFRALMDQADFGESGDLALVNLLRGYNHLAAKAKSESLIVEIPSE